MMKTLLPICLVAAAACGSAPSATSPASPRAPSASPPPVAAAPARADADEVAAADARVERGRALLEAWKFADAVRELEPAVAAYEAHLPITDARVADTMVLLGRACRGSQRWQLGTAVLERALAIVRRAGRQPAVATVLNELGLITDDSGRPRAAIAYFEQALAIDDELGLADENPDRLAHLHNLALAYSDAGSPQQAIRILERVLAADRRSDPTSVSTANTMHNLALEYRDTGDLERARPLFESAIRIVSAELGHDHPHVLPLLNGLGGTLMLMGESAEAELVYSQVLRLTSPPGRHDNYRATALSEIATLEAKRGKLDEAVAHIDESLATMRRLWPDGHAETVKVLVKRTEVLLARKDRARAEADTNAAIALADDIHADNLDEVVDTIEWLADTWRDAGHPRRANELRARARRLKRK